MPELCEIEEQGGLTVDRGTRLYAPRAEGRPAVAALPFESEGDFGFVDELQPSERTREGASSAALRRLSRCFG